jgi:hypothetical protein
MRPIKRYVLALAIAVVLCTGCDINLKWPDAEGAARAKAQAETVGGTAGDTLTRLEQSLDREIVTPESAEKYEPRATQIASGAGYAETGARAVKGFLPGEYQPYAEGAAVLFGLSGAAAAALAEFYRKQKQAAVKTIVQTADQLPDGGNTASEVAARNGLSKDVQDEYEKRVSLGLAGKSAT